MSDGRNLKRKPLSDLSNTISLPISTSNPSLSLLPKQSKPKSKQSNLQRQESNAQSRQSKPQSKQSNTQSQQSNTHPQQPKSVSECAQPTLSNSLTSVGSNDARQLQLLPLHNNTSDDGVHCSTPQPIRPLISDHVVFEDSKTYTRRGAEKNKGKAVAVALSCPPVGRVRSFGGKLKGEYKDGKACSVSHKISKKH